jgi:putative PIN family toxin of toxin-antitoxin system
VVSAATFAEFTEVLFRKKFDKYFNEERRLQIVQKLERDTLVFDVNVSIDVCRDPKDNKFLELAMASAALCIVTGDQDLLILHPFSGIQIISAVDFLRLDV